MRWVRYLSLTSFRFRVTTDTLVSLARRFPLLGLVRDLHPLDNTHASQTKWGTNLAASSPQKPCYEKNIRYDLHFTYDSNLCAFKEGNDRINFLTWRHLFLNLVDSIEDACLTMENKTVCIGDMTYHLMVGA